MEAAEAFDGHHFAGNNQAADAAQRFFLIIDIPSSPPIPLHFVQGQGRLRGSLGTSFVADFQPNARPAFGAGNRLRVITPVCGIGIFMGAGRAHLEACHRRVGSVVGEVANNSETRPAMSAVHKWVAIMPILGIEEFS